MATINRVCSFFCLFILMGWIYHIIVHVQCMKTVKNVHHKISLARLENDRLYQSYTDIIQRRNALRTVAAHDIVRHHRKENATRQHIDRIHSEIPRHYHNAQVATAILPGKTLMRA
jgi:hypothetical protein